MLASLGSKGKIRACLRNAGSYSAESYCIYILLLLLLLLAATAVVPAAVASDAAVVDVAADELLLELL